MRMIREYFNTHMDAFNFQVKFVWCAHAYCRGNIKTKEVHDIIKISKKLLVLTMSGRSKVNVSNNMMEGKCPIFDDCNYS